MKLFASSLLLAVCLLAAPVYAAMPAQPSLKVTTLDGKPYDLSAQRGHWVIVNFWATWCVPCIKELPEISQFVKSHPDIRAIGIAYDDTDPADIRAFLDKHPVSFPMAQVTMDKPLTDFDEPRGLPTTYLIGPDGKVAKHFMGPITPAALSAAIGK
ncbi:TlpA disulfide reductase family protein [Dyella sp.]|uniref:TlpA family protein disulfide reductase n=2 Tax=Dyella sp. TaxID=1869338 RepID=UPI002D765FCF|nr:TlpA disulfide reductase family protein [Dyella sp.]HET7331073.1 TlpA disulfide reductase family protein [Dyella sp.]